MSQTGFLVEESTNVQDIELIVCVVIIGAIINYDLKWFQPLRFETTSKHNKRRYWL